MTVQHQNLSPKFYNLVQVGLNHTDTGIRWTVRCKACGPNQQTTGQGGYEDVADATALAQNHRLGHLLALVKETT